MFRGFALCCLVVGSLAFTGCAAQTWHRFETAHVILKTNAPKASSRGDPNPLPRSHPPGPLRRLQPSPVRPRVPRSRSCLVGRPRPRRGSTLAGPIASESGADLRVGSPSVGPSPGRHRRADPDVELGPPRKPRESRGASDRAHRATRKLSRSLSVVGKPVTSRAHNRPKERHNGTHFFNREAGRRRRRKHG